mmetsp:Transcript_100118/g.161395  ORF Transcript_100118/g.161395 Transcript_100118/m.161395 type:complete len:112 (+) Transcript_100118:264-599(+)
MSFLKFKFARVSRASGAGGGGTLVCNTGGKTAGCLHVDHCQLVVIICVGADQRQLVVIMSVSADQWQLVVITWQCRSVVITWQCCVVAMTWQCRLVMVASSEIPYLRLRSH